MPGASCSAALAKDIMVAARNGADPASNARLRLVVEQARKVSMPRDTLDRAIRKAPASPAKRFTSST